MAYQLEGRMIEVCSCETVCPCFIDEFPDGGTCDVTDAWQIDRGTIEERSNAPSLIPRSSSGPCTKKSVEDRTRVPPS